MLNPLNAVAAEVYVPLAGIGPMSRGAEAIAASVGAGILLGGFVAGTIALLGFERMARDRVADAGYLGGWLAVGLLLHDWCRW
jgi:hypothetical protein